MCTIVYMDLWECDNLYLLLFFRIMFSFVSQSFPTWWCLLVSFGLQHFHWSVKILDGMVWVAMRFVLRLSEYCFSQLMVQCEDAHVIVYKMYKVIHTESFRSDMKNPWLEVACVSINLYLKRFRCHKIVKCNNTQITQKQCYHEICQHKYIRNIRKTNGVRDPKWNAQT